MRIISSFIDYYDCMQGTDDDKKTLWIRKPESVKLAIHSFYSSYNYQHNGVMEWPFPLINRYTYDVYSVEQVIIGFCGKIYPVLGLTYHNRPDAKKLCRSATEVHEWVQQNCNAKEIEMYNSSKYWFRGVNRQISKEVRKNAIEHYFEECSNVQNNFLKLFEDKRTPVFVAERDHPVHDSRHYLPHYEPRITYNAPLKPWEFYRVFDPAHAYQEILMFMNNMAVPMKPTPKLDDVTMAESKGFNKFSFRKAPIKKKHKK